MKIKTVRLLIILILVLCVSLVLSLVSNSSSLEEKICNELSEDGLICTEVVFIDNNSDLVFFKDENNLRYAIVNDDLSVVNVSVGILDLNELTPNDPLIWKVSNTLLWGFATEEVQSILITGDNDIQPNKIRYRGVWLWYHSYEGEVKLPVLLNAYDKDGTLIYGKE